MLCFCFPWGSFKTNNCNTSSIFARVLITRHHTGNAIHTSQDIHHGHYIRQRGGLSLPLPSSAADFRGSNSLPAPAPGRCRRRRRLPPFLLPRGEPQVANPTNLAIRFCKITHKDLPCAPRPPPPSTGHPASTTKCPSLLPGLARRNAGLGLFVFPLPSARTLGIGSLTSATLRPAIVIVQSLHHGKHKIKFRKEE